MPTILEYPQKDVLETSDVFLLDGQSGTRKMGADILAKGVLDRFAEIGVPTSELSTDDSILVVKGQSGTRKMKITRDLLFDYLDKIATFEDRFSTFRGKNLGSEVTEAQLASIDNGSFKGFFLGDYWEMEYPGIADPVKFRIIDADYFYPLVGVTAAENLYSEIPHHVVVMPDCYLETGVMNDTDVPTGGLLGSKGLSATIHGIIAPKIENMVGFNKTVGFNSLDSSTVIGNPPEVTWAGAGAVFAHQWVKARHRIPALIQIVGSPIPYGMNKDLMLGRQFRLFSICPEFIKATNTDKATWTSTSHGFGFMGITPYWPSYINGFNASEVNGFRTYFCIGVAQDSQTTES